PSALSFTSNPISRALGTSFVFARCLKSACEGISCVLMTWRPRPSISAHELLFRDIPPDDGRQVTRLFLLLQTAHHYAAFKRTCNQGGQFRRIDIGTHLASSLPLLGN